MTLDENLADLERHHSQFIAREAFAFSILDDDEVIGCLYIYPRKDGTPGADVYSWVRATRADMDSTVRQSVRRWLEDVWPFPSFEYVGSK